MPDSKRLMPFEVITYNEGRSDEITRLHSDQGILLVKIGGLVVNIEQHPDEPWLTVEVTDTNYEQSYSKYTVEYPRHAPEDPARS